MKTKELIRQLQEIDPTGETEVCIDNQPIHFAEHMPAYYDGLLKSLIQNENKTITGMKVIMNGSKVKLRYLEMEDVISEDTEAIIDLSDLDPRRQAEWTKKVEELRQYWRKWHAENPPVKTQP